MKEFRLAVTGGRDFTDKKAVFSTLDRVNRKRPITLSHTWSRTRC